MQFLTMSLLRLFSVHIYILFNITYGSIINRPTESFNDSTTELFSTEPVSTVRPVDYLTRLHWADSAFSFIKSLNCSNIYFTSQRECNHLLNVRKRSVVAYVAQPSRQGEDGDFLTVLPDGGLSRAGIHHGVVALDPHPDANFGHLVIVFFIDKISNQATCERRRGKYIGNGECMKLALKHRCRNAIERRRRNQSIQSTMSSRFLRKMVRRCEINFLPFVRRYSDREPAVIEGISQGYNQALKCHNDLEEYSLCPELRPANETLNLVCNPIRDNTRRCETTHDTVGTSCRMFEGCDKAVLLSGGWNRQTSVPRHADNIGNMYQLLRRNGFQESSIKIFFANGMHRGIQGESGAESVNTEIFPAAMKVSMRLHIRRLCATPHCTQTLVLYLNSPSKTDGTMLLWDVNKNGKAEPEERYNVTELLEDIQGCQASTVQIIADQSFSGEITKAIRKSSNHPNVFAFASGKENEYSYLSTFTDLWTRNDHSHTCTDGIFHQIKSAMVQSTPDIGMNSVSRPAIGPDPVTLFGAPCNVDPPFSANELRLWYQGCQNIPSEVWLRTFFASPNTKTSSSNPARQNNRVSSVRHSSRGGGSAENTHNNNIDSVSSAARGRQELRSNSLPVT